MKINRLIPDEKHIILKRDNKDEMIGSGLIIPEAISETQPLFAGVVTTMGVYKPYVFKTSYGEELEIRDGTRVLFEKSQGSFFNINGEEIIFINKQFVVAVFV